MHFEFVFFLIQSLSSSKLIDADMDCELFLALFQC